MFGYCRYDRDELKVKDLRQYSSYYCTLCHALGEQFGFVYRLMLSHDATFLLICLDGVSSQRTPSRHRCPVNPLYKIRLQINEEALQYVAFLDYFLVLQKLQDEIRDERMGIKRFAFRVLYHIASRNKKYLILADEYKDTEATITHLFDKL